jgi:hypothetical protein
MLKVAAWIIQEIAKDSIQKPHSAASMRRGAAGPTVASEDHRSRFLSPAFTWNSLAGMAF